MRRQDLIGGTTGTYETEMLRLKKAFCEADAILVGAGSGLSAAAGYRFDGPRLQAHFADFVEKYGMADMYTGCFARFESREERWAYWSRWAWINRYEPIPKDTLSVLRALLDGRDYFVLTTNIDHTFQRAGYPKDRLCYTQGDFGLFQCAVPCHENTYDNKDVLEQMVKQEKDGKVPTALIPHCPRCGAEMDFNLYWDDRFVRDEGWHIAHDRYLDYVDAHRSGKVLFLELGVGYNSPGVIKYPFWRFTMQNPQAIFASVNRDQPSYPEEIADRAIVISADLDKTIRDLHRMVLENN